MILCHRNKLLYKFAKLFIDDYGLEFATSYFVLKVVDKSFLLVNMHSKKITIYA